MIRKPVESTFHEAFTLRFNIFGDKAFTLSLQKVET